MTAGPTTDELAAALVAGTDRMAELLGEVDPDARVPTCPDWSYRQLVKHVGRGHRWGAVIVERRATDEVPWSDVDDFALPEGVAARQRWLRAGAERVVAAVRDAGVDTPAWGTWQPAATAGFWLRRLTHEAVVHGADAAFTAGTPVAAPAGVAADTVTELLEALVALEVRGVRAGPSLAGDGQTLHFHATDPDLGDRGEWLLTRAPDGLAFERRHGKGDVAVRASAVDLMLLVNRRLPPSAAGVTVLGERAVLDDYLARALF